MTYADWTPPSDINLFDFYDIKNVNRFDTNVSADDFNGSFSYVCLNGDCRNAWPAGGTGGGTLFNVSNGSVTTEIIDNKTVTILGGTNIQSSLTGDVFTINNEMTNGTNLTLIGKVMNIAPWFINWVTNILQGNITNVNDSMKQYVDTQDTFFNNSMTAYVDAQDVVFNDSMVIYVDAQDIIFNSSMKTYVDAQDVIFNTSMKTYVDNQDVTFNNSMKEYVDQQVSITNFTVNVTNLESYVTNQTTQVCPGGNYSYGYFANGTPRCRNDTNGAGASVAAARQWGYIVGNTSLALNGDHSNASHTGYNRSNALCADKFSGSHFCLEVEVLKGFANGTAANRVGTYWMQKGAPGFTAEANDCSGWNISETTSLGPFWNFDLPGFGQGKLTNCGQVKSLLCCD